MQINIDLDLTNPVLIFCILFAFAVPAYSARLYKEIYYQNLWCNQWHGIQEYKLPDKTRVDCLTKNYAVEFDFANKWAESIGQSLYYAKLTNKHPAVILIIEEDSDFRYYKRAETLAKDYNIKLWYMKSPQYNNYSKKQYNSKSAQNPLFIVSDLIKSQIIELFRI